MNSYTATIVDEKQGLLSCSSTNTSCRVPNLKCGRLYTVTVCHHDGMCPSMPSEAIFMESGTNTIMSFKHHLAIAHTPRFSSVKAVPIIILTPNEQINSLLSATLCFSVFRLLLLDSWQAARLFWSLLSTASILHKSLHQMFFSRGPEQQTDNVRNQLMNRVEHSAAKGPDSSLRSWIRA